MEISHASVETQVAAVGINGQAEEVTVSTDAEFMMMIAHGIYSNKALALIRELLCNARDGHAKAGCLDKPIHVTLTDNLLVVRDYGTGIPNAIFAKTYMTFGKSTKRQDKAATGGFGVGTKVPWAVCDVFSARNWIDKTMTAYSIIKFDPNKDNKPTCTPVMSIPSIEPSGVEVSVPFPEKMLGEISRYLILFANELGIPLVINGNKHVTNLLEIEELRNVGFVRLANHPKTVTQQSPFYVRQGDVIYPIEPQEEFQDAYDMLSYLNNGGGNPILFMAEPDSIIPTLSRESLQYTDRTSKSIRDLMKKVLQVLANNVDGYAERTQQHLPPFVAKAYDFVGSMWTYRIDLGNQLNDCHGRHLIDANLSNSQNFLLRSNMERWLNARTPYLETQKVSGKVFRENIQKTVDTLFTDTLKKYHYFDHARLLEVWREQKNNSWNKSVGYEQRVTRELYEEVMIWRAEAKFNPDIVEVYIPKSEDFKHVTTSVGASRYFLALTELKSLDTNKEKSFNNLDFVKKSVYLSKTVILSTTVANMLQRAREKFERDPINSSNPLLGGSVGRLAGARCVRIKATMKPHEVQRMKHQIEGWGYTVLILMDPTKDELEERRRAAEERAALKAVELPILHELVQPTGQDSREIKLSRRRLKGLSLDPAFKGEALYFILPRGKDLPYGMKTVDDFVRLTKFVGTDIVCVSTKSEIQKVIKEGRKNIDTALLEFAQWFFKRADIYEKLFYRGTFFVKRAEQNKYLTKYLFNRLPPVLDKQEEQIYIGLQTLSGVFSDLNKFVQGRINYFKTCCTPEQHYEVLFRNYAASHFCDVHRALDKAFSGRPSPKRALARSILKTILKGPA